LTITVLGSAAAEGFPGLFCVCDICGEARRRGGKDLRRRTAYLLDDTVMVDFGPDVYHSMIALGVDYAPLRHLLVSHSHQDHWYPAELFFRRPGFSILAQGSHLDVHGNQAVADRLGGSIEDLSRLSLAMNVVRAFEEVDLGEGITAVGVKADHAGDEEALNWIVRTPTGAVLFGNDTGWYPQETWDFLGGAGLKLAILDCTSASLPHREGHMGVAAVVEAREMLDKIGALAPGARVIANHFSHNGRMLHADLEAYLNPHGIEVGWDGLRIDL
jgi:phosphoribosyl 1,2-cyclic phosphate phosphodiesterase